MKTTLPYATRGNGPLATEDQQAVECAALELLDHSIVQKAIATAAQELKKLVPHDPGSEMLFESEFEQLCFTALEAAVNSDPNYPRIHAVNVGPHLTRGRRIPGTKVMHPSPDFIYRMGPVDGFSRFVLHGQIPQNGPIAFEVSLLGATGATQGNLSLADLTISSDGSFTISVNPNGADGRANHLQSGPGARQLMIRDIFDHIECQEQIALRIERLDPPTRRALEIGEIVARVPGELARANNLATTVVRVAAADANVLPPPGFLNHSATLVTQAYSMGRFNLTEDQALVLTLTLGAAAYAVVPVTNCWGGLGGFPKQPRGMRPATPTGPKLAQHIRDYTAWTGG